MASKTNDEQTEEGQEICDTYKQWKKTVPHLYDFVIARSLEMSASTVQWLPDVEQSEDGNYSTHKLIMGTCSEEEQNYVQIMHLNIQNHHPKKDVVDNDEDIYVFGQFDKLTGPITIDTKIKHPGYVSRARYMPQKPNIIATKSSENDVLIFNYSKRLRKRDRTGKPMIRLSGHESTGFGLSWNTNAEGLILSASEDKTICLWDINAKSSKNRTLMAKTTFRGHEKPVEDVSWHLLHETLFASTGDDKMLMIWDTRCNNTSKASHAILAHTDDANCVAFNPFSEFVLATGSADKTVALWDLRNLKLKLHSLESHKKEVFQLEWNPHNEMILASSSIDRMIHIWDLDMIDEEPILEPPNRSKIPSELLFIHSGHTDHIGDFGWNINEDSIICSVSNDFIIQIWQMSEQNSEDTNAADILQEIPLPVDIINLTLYEDTSPPVNNNVTNANNTDNPNNNNNTNNNNTSTI